MNSALEEFVLRLDQWGVMDVFVPFILVFTLVFAVLQKSKILGKEEERRKFNVIIALVIALAVVIPHITGDYPYGADIVDMINRALPNVALVVIAIIMLLVMIGVWGNDINIKESPLAGFAVIFSFVAVFIIFGGAAGWWGGNWPVWLSWLGNPDAQVIVVGILVFGIIIWFVTAEPKAKDKEAMGNDMWRKLWKD
jgi:predicted Na+-dependent transporter